MIVAPPLAEDREEAEARHALDRLRSEGGYANTPTAADQCEWSAAAGMVEACGAKIQVTHSAHKCCSTWPRQGQGPGAVRRST